MTPPSRGARGVQVRPKPLSGDLFGSLTMPVFWLLAGLLLVCAARLGTMIAPPFRHYPVAMTTALVVFALYAVPFVIYIGNLDHLEREPPVLLGTAFAWGAVVVTATAVPGNVAADNLTAKLVSPRFAAMWGPALAGPTVEEILKFLGVVVIALLATAQVNSVVDGIVYGAMVGLGYQVMENVSYAAVAVQAAGTGDRMEPIFNTLIARGVFGGPWSHTVFTALAGAGVGYAVVRVDRPTAVRAGVAALCLGGAWLCHFAWNSPLLTDGFGLGAAGKVIALLVKGVPVLALALLLARLARRREGAYYAGVLAGLADPRIVTPGELRAISSLGGRAALRRAAYARAGGAGERAARRLQDSQARLAVELSRGPGADGGLTPAAATYARDVLRARHELAALSLGPADSRPFAGSTVMWLIGAWVTVAGALGLAFMLRALT
ncbi:PrsW family intramembrane metalloprotease [Planosporangium sp. 12N6]|uniref:PrsW family intramembrane metalloprotease n=1 Tax=Planosporangium spinosum TaxID=3402278 RepID=UPI003CF717AF